MLSILGFIQKVSISSASLFILLIWFYKPNKKLISKLFYLVEKIIATFIFQFQVMKRIILFLFLSVMICTTFLSCVKKKLFPVEPSIEFKEFVKYQSTPGVWDSADCIIKFKDGDGDIGIVSGDQTSAPDFIMEYMYDSINQDPGNPNYGHPTGIFVSWDVTQGNPGWQPLLFTYRVPDITPEGQYKAIEGEIRAKFRSAPYFVPGHTRIRYRITLRDREGHQSNEVTTDDITIP